MPINHLFHVTEDHSIYNAGITTAVDTLMRQLASKPVAIHQTIFTTNNETIPLPDGVSEVRATPSGFGRTWRYVPGANAPMTQAISQADVVHLHGIWMWAQWAAARTAHKLNKPFILSVHGMLEPWIWARQKWPDRVKKVLYWYLMAHPAFRHASVIHAIHPIEAETLKKFFKNSNDTKGLPVIEVIPHSLDLDTIDRIIGAVDPAYCTNKHDYAHNFSSDQRDRYILFLGRLHPVKGVDLLIRAFSSLDTQGVKLKIAGFAQVREAAYESYLHQIVTDAGLSERVEFLGGVHDLQKWELIRNAWVFCLPSHSEVIGMVNLEAAACCTPVITTHITGVGPDWAINGGLLIEPEVTQLKCALDQALRWDVQERNERGLSMRRLLEKAYSWDATMGQWMSVYERVGAAT